jgi:hypothetical protein
MSERGSRARRRRRGHSMMSGGARRSRCLCGGPRQDLVLTAPLRAPGAHRQLRSAAMAREISASAWVASATSRVASPRRSRSARTASEPMPSREEAASSSARCRFWRSRMICAPPDSSSRRRLPSCSSCVRCSCTRSSVRCASARASGAAALGQGLAGLALGLGQGVRGPAHPGPARSAPARCAAATAARAHDRSARPASAAVSAWALSSARILWTSPRMRRASVSVLELAGLGLGHEVGDLARAQLAQRCRRHLLGPAAQRHDAQADDDRQDQEPEQHRGATLPPRRTGATPASTRTSGGTPDRGSSAPPRPA